MSLLKQKVRAYEQWLIEETIRECGGSLQRTAQVLGICDKTLYIKTRRRVPAAFDERWDDGPLAWAIRRDGDRVELGACWTKEQIEAEAVSQTTVAIALDNAAAVTLQRDINTKLAIDGAIRTASMAAV